VALAAATATGVVLGPRFAGTAVWVVAACCLAVACLAAGGPSRLRDEGGGAAVGLLVLGALLASGAAAASVRATAVRGGILVERAGSRRGSRSRPPWPRGPTAPATGAPGSCSP
jgi:hypothetical protein